MNTYSVKPGDKIEYTTDNGKTHHTGIVEVVYRNSVDILVGMDKLYNVKNSEITMLWTKESFNE